MVGNLNRRSKRIEVTNEQNMLSKTKDTGENNLRINKDFMYSSAIDVFKNVRYYSSGILDEKVSLALEVGQAKLCSYLSHLCDFYIIGKDPEIEETTDLDVPTVSQDWVLASDECGKLLPAAAFSLSPSKDQLMSGVKVCISGVSRPDACSIWAMLKFNGGQVDTKLTEATTHLVATSDQGKLYEKALVRSDVFVVTPDWVIDSVQRKIKCIENLYHPRLLDTSGAKLINTRQIAPIDQHSDASEIKPVSKTTVIEDYNPEPTPPVTNLDVTRRSNLNWFANLFSMSSERTSPSQSESIKKKVKIENKMEEKNKLNHVRKIEVSGRPKGLESKHPLKKEKAGGNSTRIKKAMIKSKAAEAKNPTTQQRKTRKQSIIEAILVNPGTQQLASQYSSNRIKSIPIVEQEVAIPTNQIKINPFTENQVARKRRNNQNVSDNQTTQTQNVIQSHCLPNLLDSSTMMPSNDSFQRSKFTKSSSVKRKLAEKEDNSKVSRKLISRKISKLSENCSSSEDYSCQMCDKTFRQKRNLLVHIATAHEGVRFPCPMCYSTASTKSNLKRHMEVKHNVQKHNIVHDNVKVEDNNNKDVIEYTVTCHPKPISSPAITHTSHDSFYTLQLADEKQNVAQDLSLLDTAKSSQNHIVKLSPQPKSSNCIEHHVRNSQDDDLKQQECAPNKPSKYHQTTTNSQPVLSLSVHNVPLLKSKLLLASVPTTPEYVTEVSPVVHSWTVEETITQVSRLDPKLAPHVQIFRSHEIDGQALLLVTPDMMVEYLGMKLGPALKVGLIIEKLKRN